MSGSLSYRKNEASILRGDVPEKYTRLLPYIQGERILEIGSAEGVLALLLAAQNRKVWALERSEDRHNEARALAHRWVEDGIIASVYVTWRLALLRGDIVDHLHLLEGKDTLVAVRMIYYLGADLDRVFAAAAKAVPNVVLCGNKNRAAWWRQGIPDKEGGPVNYYASHEGMRDLLDRHGYSIVAEERDGDPIVVGRR